MGCCCCVGDVLRGGTLVGVPALWGVGWGLAGHPGIDVNIPAPASYHAQTPGALCHQ